MSTQPPPPPSLTSTLSNSSSKSPLPTTSIKVFVRLRPLTPSELSPSSTQTSSSQDETNNNISFEYSSTSLKESTQTGQKIYRFDSVFGPNSTNSSVYTTLGKTLVLHALSGFNSTIFTYGQTGSGKTHSILGNDDDPGFIPRCVDDVFDFVDNNKSSKLFKLSVSYLEVYNEEINDLLIPGEEGKNLKIVSDDAIRGVVIDCLTEHPVSTKIEVLDVVKLGESQRRYGSTLMNDRSSRSHTLFRFIIESRSVGDGDMPEVSELKQSTSTSSLPNLSASSSSSSSDGVYSKVNKPSTSDNTPSSRKLSYLNLVDLAGSERSNTSNTTGSTLKEGSNINKSLLALGAVISKLGEANKKSNKDKDNKPFVPFRDSKLTRILKISLGGNTLTSVLCTITSSNLHHDETVSTLRFGQLCKMIKNVGKVNEVFDDKAIARKMKVRVSELEVENSTVNDKLNAATVKIDEGKKRNEELQGQIKDLQDRGRTSSPDSSHVDFDDLLFKQQAGEIKYLQELVASMNIQSDKDKRELTTLTEYKLECDKNYGIIKDLEEELVLLQDEKSDGEEGLTERKRHLEGEHEERQAELEKKTEAVKNMKDTLEKEQHEQGIKRMKLDELEKLLSSKVAALDDKESALKEEMDQLRAGIDELDGEKRELQVREDEVIAWSEEHEDKEKGLQSKIEEIKAREVASNVKDAGVRKAEQKLNSSSLLLDGSREDDIRRRFEIDNTEKTLQDNGLKIVEWKKALKSRELEVEERERTTKIKDDSVKGLQEQLFKQKKELNQLKLDLSAKDEGLMSKQSVVDQGQRKIDRLKPILEAKEKDLDRRSQALEVQSKLAIEGTEFNKLTAVDLDEREVEVVIKRRHLEEREGVCIEKEGMLQLLEGKSDALDQRIVKQTVKEEQWTNTICQVNASHSAALKEVEEYLSDQIDAANAFEIELAKAREDIEVERMGKAAAMKQIVEMRVKLDAVSATETKNEGVEAVVRSTSTEISSRDAVINSLVSSSSALTRFLSGELLIPLSPTAPVHVKDEKTKSVSISADPSSKIANGNANAGRTEETGEQKKVNFVSRSEHYKTAAAATVQKNKVAPRKLHSSSSRSPPNPASVRANTKASLLSPAGTSRSGNRRSVPVVEVDLWG